MRAGNRRRAFSLVELVVVIMIIGILSAIAVPRLSRGASGAAESAVAADLKVLNNAILAYAVEHGNVFPGPDADRALKQLTLYTAADGTTNAVRTKVYRFGPYISAIPPCPVGPNADKDTAARLLIADTSPPTPKPESGDGWVYNPTTGEIAANVSGLAKLGGAQPVGEGASELPVGAEEATPIK